MAMVYLGLGSNMGDRQARLAAAVRGLNALPKTKVIRIGGVYETAPVGGPAEQGDYLNSACQIETGLTPRELLAEIHALEEHIGRDRSEDGYVMWGPRVIDIDILLWDGVTVSDPDLFIPHPRLAIRAFALLPLADIAPDTVHPFEGLTVRQLLERIENPYEGIRRLPL